MADLSQIKLPNNSTYTLKDALARGLVALGSCDTEATEQVKVITIDYAGWTRTVGCIIGVKFAVSSSYTASAEAPVKLNVNNSGNASVYYNNVEYVGSSTSVVGYINRYIFYMWDGTYWVWLNMGTLDGNTDTKVQQNAAITTNGAYPVILAYSTATTKVTNIVNKASGFTYNPSTKALVTGGTVNGYTLAAASAKAVDTSISAASTSTKLPTSQAVASFVEGKGYATSSDVSSTYALKADTVLTSTLSRGRKANTTSGTASLAFGTDVEASGDWSTAIGYGTTASDDYAFASGLNCTASGGKAVAIGTGTVASGLDSFASGYYTIASGQNQHVSGMYNIGDSAGVFTEIVGNGSSDSNRKNIRALTTGGNEHLDGYVYVFGAASASAGSPICFQPSSSFTVASGSSVTKYNSHISSRHQLVKWNFYSGSAYLSENCPPSDLTWTTQNGYFTISNTGSTAVTICPVFAIPENLSLTDSAS